MGIKVGDKLYCFDSQQHKAQERVWSEFDIKDETKRSWVVGRGNWEAILVSKNDLTSAPPNPKHSTNRERYYTFAGREEFIADDKWKIKHHHETKCAVEFGSVALLKKVRALLVVEGVLPKEGV